MPTAEVKPAALFVLMSILPKLLLALMGRNFAQFAFSSAGHFSVSFWLSRRLQNKIRKPPRMLAKYGARRGKRSSTHIKLSIFLSWYYLCYIIKIHKRAAIRER
jgi:hypothetical protein